MDEIDSLILSGVLPEETLVPGLVEALRKRDFVEAERLVGGREGAEIPRAFVYYQMGREDDALAILERMRDSTAALLGRAKYYRALYRLTELRQCLERLSSEALTPGQRAFVLSLEGDLSFFNGEYRAAQEAYTKAAELSDRIGNTYLSRSLKFALSSCYMGFGDYKKAAEAFRAILQSPLDERQAAIAEMNLGECYLYMNRLDEAEESIASAISLGEAKGDMKARRFLVDCYVDMGLICSLKGKMEEAETLYRKAMSMDVGGEGLLFSILKRNRELIESALFRAREADGIRAYLEGVMESVPYGVWVEDMERRCRFINTAVERMTGYARDEILGKTVFERSYMEFYLSFPQNANKVMSPDVPKNDVVPFKRRDGKIIPVLVSQNDIKDSRGAAIGRVFIGREVSIESLPVISALSTLSRMMERRPDTMVQLLMVALYTLLGESFSDILKGCVEGYDQRRNEHAVFDEFRITGVRDWGSFIEFLLELLYQCIGPEIFELCDMPIIEDIAARVENRLASERSGKPRS